MKNLESGIASTILLDCPDVQTIRGQAIDAGGFDPFCLTFQVVEYCRDSNVFLGIVLTDAAFGEAVEETTRLIGKRPGSVFCLCTRRLRALNKTPITVPKKRPSLVSAGHPAFRWYALDASGVLPPCRVTWPTREGRAKPIYRGVGHPLTVCNFIRLVEPARPTGVPATKTTLLPGNSSSRSTRRVSICPIISSVVVTSGASTGETP